jgi:predicted metal-dependent enzyme (double-stranded beta helix superfamily)
MVATPASIKPLRDFVVATSGALQNRQPEARTLDVVGALLSRLVARDDWLPADLAAPDPLRYRQYLLHADPLGRFCVVSFVWGPGQSTPVHDHTVWGLVGMLRGKEVTQAYALDDGGRALPQGQPITLHPGQVEAVSPRIGDIHGVRNAHDDRVSISVHVYGANIGSVRRSVYTEDGGRVPFVSGYSDARLPNLWSLV